MADHKIIIECPVAQDPEIFSKINGSMEMLKKTIKSVEKTADDATETAENAKKKVDFLYWFFGSLGAIIIVGAAVYQLVLLAS